ncbi:hypothetical protein OH491_13620 [Termitidicoccus mucosus]|uniref:Transposase n=1 Tax=Termitidicoccus mucosus TaxID=1184151 RepID=A0A178IJN0_9BACT|nr:hypothetical protein AW736_13830 [Opitutaceae bacterium TSB47]
MSAAVTTTIPILAFSPPVVKAGEVEVALHAAGRLIKLTGSEEMFFKFARGILVAPRAKPPARAVNGATLADYRRVVARVNAGENWVTAAAAEGVASPGNVAKWWKRECARRAADNASGAILKPSGEIL